MHAGTVAVGIENFARGSLPTEAAGLAQAGDDEPLAEFVIQQNLFDAAGDIEDIFGVHDHGGVADDFRQRTDVG